MLYFSGADYFYQKTIIKNNFRTLVMVIQNGLFRTFQRIYREVTMDYNTENIWKDILLKNAEGNKFKNTITIPQIDKVSRKKYQIFEILVAETLARISPDVIWEVTHGSKDGGVDIIGLHNSTFKTPFLKETPQQLTLGQIKRRNKGYRLDLFRDDIIKMYEYYTSNYTSKGKSLFQLIFVISTDNISNLNNLKKDLQKELEDKSHIRFVANISSPINLIDASDIIKYWKLNLSFASGILEDVLSREQMEAFQSYLMKLEVNWISVRVEGNICNRINEKFVYCVTIISDIKELPIHLNIEWKRNSDNIQLLYPLQFITSNPSGYELNITNEYRMSLCFRGLQEGVQNLGKLIISSDDNSYVQEIELNNVNIQNDIFPIYQVAPNKEISEILEKAIDNENPTCDAFAVTGCGGIGKSSLISDIFVRAANRKYLCIDVQHFHIMANGSEFWSEIFLQIYSQYYHKILYEDKITEYTKEFLGSAFQTSWEKDISALLNNGTYYVGNMVECLVSVLCRAAQNHNILIWLSDMHWMSENTGELLRKVIDTLKGNQSFLCHKIIFLVEGRANEMLLVEHKYRYPFAWNNFLTKTGIEVMKMNLWKRNESKRFIIALLHCNQNKVNSSTKIKELTEFLLEYCNGVPMHILEQLKYLIIKNKIFLKSDGSLVVEDANWKGLFSDDIKELIQLRIQYYREKYSELMDYVIIMARLSNYQVSYISTYVLTKMRICCPGLDALIMEMGFLNIENNHITFLHEYYNMELRKLEVNEAQIVRKILKWCNELPLKDIAVELCRIELAFMDTELDYDDVCKKIRLLLSTIEGDDSKVILYEHLLKVPKEILKKNEYYKHHIYFELAQVIVRSGDWNFAKDYLLKIINECNENSSDYAYYKALAYQDLANIDSGQLLLDESIEYVRKGLADIEKGITLFPNDYNRLSRAKELLLERLSICQLFSGDLENALITQNTAFKSARKRCDYYMMFRIDYERGGTRLHTNVKDGIQRLKKRYNESLECMTLYEEEPTLIHAMLLVGKLMNAKKIRNKKKMEEIYNESMKLEYSIQDRSYNYAASINLQTAACARLIQTDSVEEAFPIFIKSLEKAIDSNLDELLWKCYINIAQCYLFLGKKEEAVHYADKCNHIIESMRQMNPNSRERLDKLYALPVACANNIHNGGNNHLSHDGLQIHNITWNNLTFFIMN